jgi:hypothetical protein
MGDWLEGYNNHYHHHYQQHIKLSNDVGDIGGVWSSSILRVRAFVLTQENTLSFSLL